METKCYPLAIDGSQDVAVDGEPFDAGFIRFRDDRTTETDGLTERQREVLADMLWGSLSQLAGEIKGDPLLTVDNLIRIERNGEYEVLNGDDEARAFWKVAAERIPETLR